LGVDGQVEGDEAVEDIGTGTETDNQRLEQHRAFVRAPGQVAHVEPHAQPSSSVDLRSGVTLEGLASRNASFAQSDGMASMRPRRLSVHQREISDSSAA